MLLSVMPFNIPIIYHPVVSPGVRPQNLALPVHSKAATTLEALESAKASHVGNALDIPRTTLTTCLLLRATLW